MKLTLTRKAAYGLALLKALAEMPAGAKMTTAELAEASGVPKGFVPSIVSTLHRAGLLRCVPGRTGGCYLARPPEQVSLLEIVNALEGPLAESHCVLDGRLCMESEPCEVHDYWEKAHEAMRQSLDDCTLGRLAGATTSRPFSPKGSQGR